MFTPMWKLADSVNKKKEKIKEMKMSSALLS